MTLDSLKSVFRQWDFIESAIFPVWQISSEEERKKIVDKTVKYQMKIFKEFLDKTHATNPGKNENRSCG